jgi:aconitate hydratase
MSLQHRGGLDLAEVTPAIAGPKRPQDRIVLSNVKQSFLETLQSQTATGYGKPASEIGVKFRTTKDTDTKRSHQGGGEQAPETLPMGAGNQSTKDTSAITEIEMMTNRPTPDRIEEVLPDEQEQALREEFRQLILRLPRGCADCGDYLMHQYFQS